MSSGSVARRYARALFDLSAEAKAVDETAGGLDVVADAVSSLDADILTPGMLDAELRDRIGAAVAAKVGPDTLIARFAHLLARRDRLAEIPAIREWFQKLRDAAEGRVRIDVTTATPLAEPDMAKIIDAFSRMAGRRVVPTARVDARLLGGAIVEIEGKVFDGSVQTALERLGGRMAGRSGSAANEA
jgi:F-type H+-transporting ATPase subunit delta